MGSGVKRFRSRTVERLIELAATAQVDEKNCRKIGCRKTALTFIQFQLHFRYGPDEALQIVGRFGLLPALRRRHVHVNIQTSRFLRRAPKYRSTAGWSRTIERKGRTRLDIQGRIGRSHQTRVKYRGSQRQAALVCTRVRLEVEHLIGGNGLARGSRAVRVLMRAVARRPAGLGSRSNRKWRKQADVRRPEILPRIRDDLYSAWREWICQG